MPYFYYKLNGNQKPCELPDGLKVVKTNPRPYILGMNGMQLGRRDFIYHFFYTALYRGFRRTFTEYDLVKNDVIVSKAVLVSKDPVYMFLPAKGVHLGYCATIPQERGKGFYPLLLKYIIQDNPQMDLHMIVATDNDASIKGIEKSGFVRYAIGDRNSKGQFYINKYL